MNVTIVAGISLLVLSKKFPFYIWPTKTGAMQRSFFFSLSVILMFSLNTFAQNPQNWTSDQLIEPSDLAQILKNETSLPLIFCVGPGAVIPHSIDIGPVSKA